MQKTMDTRLHNKKPSRLLFACDCAGNYDHKGKSLAVDKSKQRENTGSKKCGCLIMVEFCPDRLSNQWILRVLQMPHNHGASAAASAHPVHRMTALTPETRAKITKLLRSGSTPGQILDNTSNI
jgi:hypothetical protein